MALETCFWGLAMFHLDREDKSELCRDLVICKSNEQEGRDLKGCCSACISLAKSQYTRTWMQTEENRMIYLLLTKV